MKTITQTIELYKLEELSDKARSKALDRWSELDDYFWYDENESTLKAFVELFDFINVISWEYGGCYRGYVNFDINTPYQYEEYLDDLAGVKLYKFLQDYMDNFKVYKTYTLRGENPYSAKKKRVSKINWRYENNCQLTGYYLDCEIMQPIFDYLADFPKNQHVTLKELIEDCFSHWVVACESDLESHFSMEYFEEYSKENNLYYHEDGTLYGRIENESEVA